MLYICLRVLKNKFKNILREKDYMVWLKILFLECKDGFGYESILERYIKFIEWRIVIVVILIDNRKSICYILKYSRNCRKFLGYNRSYVWNFYS